MAYIAGIVLIGLKVGDETIGPLYHTHVYKNINCTLSSGRPTEPWWCKALYDIQFGKFFFLFLTDSRQKIQLKIQMNIDKIRKSNLFAQIST